MEPKPRPMDLRTLYDEHAQALYAFALHLSRSETDSRDILQEIFCKLARNPPTANLRNPRAYLLKCAYRQFLDLCRRRSVREEEITDSDPIWRELDDLVEVEREGYKAKEIRLPKGKRQLDALNRQLSDAEKPSSGVNSRNSHRREPTQP